jgi:hypothetical protein
MGARVSLRIRYQRRSHLVLLLTLALVTAAFLGYLASGSADASAPRVPLASSASIRQYYLTTSTHNGAGARTACAAGYHMASLWEILDTSNLKYNATLGVAGDDSGQGPPTVGGGWVRTGYYSSGSTTPGEGNCNAWSSSSASDYGTGAWLEYDWTLPQDVHVWHVGNKRCSAATSVWCVEDYIKGIYLPLILKNY